MNSSALLRQKRRNTWHSVLLLGAMLVLFLLLGRVLFGPGGGMLILALTLLLLVLMPGASAWMTLRLYRARPIYPEQAPALHELVAALAERAGLQEVPALFLVPSATPNAFAMRHQRRHLIAVTDGLLRLLDRRELAGVLAHEMSHIRHGDLQVMQLADLLTRLTATLADIGWFSLLLMLPLTLFGGVTVPWTALLLLMAAPVLSSLLQLALSRTREFDADLGAVELTGDPEGLASALLRIEQDHVPWWQWMLFPGRQRAAPSLLRTHPLVSERVQRLRELSHQRAPLLQRPLWLDDGFVSLDELPMIRAPRRWRGFGVWF
ncbi:MAG: hypothetical protein D6678_06605 [Zetaproteobacteria bacterium]|nr:MAG: hypothetical protein D6678_06605 [Zetaproteobacteria bacterium]